MNHASAVGLGALLLTTGLAVGAAVATPQMLVEAKKAGVPANNCQYCHTEAMPKKETFKPTDLNDRGTFLLNDMKQRNLTAPDVAKLKDFKSAK